MTHSPDEIPAASADRQSTPIDYIVVGSGPGGGPLACRLAEAGMNVLVLEAGPDPGASQLPGDSNPADMRKFENDRIEYYCPGLHASATEPELYQSSNPGPAGNPPLTSWGFDATHYSRGPKIYYPRASALGGCSAHHAMISVYGYDSDWKKIADLTGDETWLPGQMRMIYEQLERVSYPKPITRIGQLWEKFLDKIAPGRNALDERGTDGWLDVTSSDPNLALKDSEITDLVAAVYFNQSGLSWFGKCVRLLKLWVHGNFYRAFDLNNAAHMRQNPEGIAMVPIAVAPGHVRRGPREFLLETRRKLNDQSLKAKARGHDMSPVGKIFIATGIFVTRVVLEEGRDGKAPQAVGVEFERGGQLYGPSQPKAQTAPAGSEICYCRREVILSCGAFNSPQLLMLSGIGDRAQIKSKLDDEAARTKKENPVKIYVDLPGVGKNLRDRCEISIISSTQREFELLRGATFQPDATNDPGLNEWKAVDSHKPRDGIYTTNGAALAILKRSRPDVIQPDLFILGLPVAFRGYYKGWSKDLFHADKNGNEQSHSLWTWVILKAGTKCCGSVELNSGNPFDQPKINFKYFNDDLAPKPEADPDMEALVSGVRFIRHLNKSARTLFKDELQPGTAKQENTDLRTWIAQEAWGHHPCGTCAIGPDAWTADTAKLTNKNSVLDSKFRVHGVRNLRVVDASVFPEIPGYFISVSTYMISEKAAASILNELSV